MSEKQGITPLGISMINIRKEKQVEQSFLRHADVINDVSKDFWFSTNLDKNKKLLFFSGLSHFTTVINANLSDQNIVLYFQKSQQALSNSEPQQSLSPEYQQLLELVVEVNQSRSKAFTLLQTEPHRILPELLVLKVQRQLKIVEAVKALGYTNYIVYVVGFNSSCHTIQIDQMVLSSGLLKLMGKDPKTEIVKTLTNKRVDEIWTEHDYLAFTKSMLVFYKKVMTLISDRKSCLNIENIVIFDGIRHLRAQGEIIKCRAVYTYRHPMIITSEIIQIERERLTPDQSEEATVEVESCIDQQVLKNKVLKYEKSTKVKTANIAGINQIHCKPIKIVSNVKNT